MSAFGKNVSESSMREAEAALAAFSDDRRAHIAKLVGENGMVLIGKWVETYFSEQSAYRNVDEFRFHLESVIDEYVGYYVSSYENVASETVRRRMGEISRKYHGLIYDGETDPYADTDQEPAVLKPTALKGAPGSELRQRELTESTGVLGRISKLLNW